LETSGGNLFKVMAKKIRPCTIYLVRHGQSDWNVQNLMQGKTSGVPLTKTGIKQARTIEAKLKQIKFAAIFSSDLMRARQTAQIIAYQRKLAVTTARAIRERSFGAYEGKTLEQYQEDLRETLKRFDALSDKDKFKFVYPHGIESIGGTVARVITFLREVAVAYAGKNVLVISHGGVLRLLLIHLGYGTYDQLPPFSIDNTGYLVLKSDGVEIEIKEVVGVHKHEG